MTDTWSSKRPVSLAENNTVSQIHNFTYTIIYLIRAIFNQCAFICCLGFFIYYLTIGPIQRVVNLYLNDVTTRLAQRDIKLNVDDIECTWLVQKGFSYIYGAHRPGIAPYKKAVTCMIGLGLRD